MYPRIVYLPMDRLWLGVEIDELMNDGKEVWTEDGLSMWLFLGGTFPWLSDFIYLHLIWIR